MDPEHDCRALLGSKDPAGDEERGNGAVLDPYAKEQPPGKNKSIVVLHDGTFEGMYVDWREKRNNYIVKHYGVDFFQGKTLLEVGCGFGHTGDFFHKLGAIVTCVDARQEHLNTCEDRFPHLRTELCDLDTEFPKGHYDICIHMGVLYHLAAPDSPLARAIEGSDHLVLETEVCDSSDPFSTHIMEENPDSAGLAVNGIGCRPSAAYIERVLTDLGATFERCDDPALNSEGPHEYDWEVKETGISHAGICRRFWFVKKLRKENG